MEFRDDEDGSIGVYPLRAIEQGEELLADLIYMNSLSYAILPSLIAYVLLRACVHLFGRCSSGRVPVRV